MKKKSLSSDDLTWKENEIHPLYTYYKSKNHPYSKYYDIENPDFYIGSLKRKTSKSTDKKIENAKKKTTKKVKLTAKSTKGKKTFSIDFSTARANLSLITRLALLKMLHLVIFPECEK